ncbi:MAG TPA: DUF47 family protein [Candidatus Bathyarchaeota archaeon]|nr:DUF47 family protein [Candidatus Bathyarchaeota archaeon]
MLPAEVTLRLRRQSLQLCQELTRHAIDALRILHTQLEALRKGDKKKVEELYSKISEYKDLAMETKRRLSTGLIEAGAILLSREDFLRYAVPVTEMVDLTEGAAYRILVLSRNNIKIDKETWTSLLRLVAGALNTAMKLRETIFSLSVNPGNVESLAHSVEESEREMDDLYRETEVTIIFAKINISHLLLLRDLSQFLEDIADKAEDAADSARILALSSF